MSGTGNVITNHALINSAELQACGTSPFVLIGAQGAGITTRVLSVTYRYNFGTTPYSEPAGGGLFYGSASGPAADSGDQQILEANASAQAQAVPIEGAVEPNAAYENQPIVFANSGGNPSGGDGTLYVTTVFITEKP